MKKGIYLSIMVFLTITILYSCKSKTYENSTEIFKDGSCQRTISLVVDSSDLEQQVFPVILDSSWKKTSTFQYKEDKFLAVENKEDTISTKGSKADIFYQITASKKFKKVEDMNLEKPNSSLNWAKLDHSFSLDKKFRWFYSYLTYKETYKKSNPFESIPVTDYISRDELLVLNGEYTEYLAGRDSAEIDKVRDEIMKKAFTWIQASIFKEFIQILSQYSGLTRNPKITPEFIKNNSDTILHTLNLKNEDISEVLFNMDSLMDICNICYNTRDFVRLKPALCPVFDQYVEKGKKLDLLFNMFGDSETNTVIMSGMLINTNCKTVIGNKIQWEFTILKSFFNDYEITVTSRTTNIWAFVVSGGFLVLLIFGLIAGSLVKRRR